MKLRPGRHRPRHVYLQIGDTPSDTDPEVALFETARGAAFYIDVVNEALAGGKFDATGPIFRSIWTRQEEL